MSQQTLREYQLDALNELRNGIRAKTGPQCLMLPTGAGKTTVASAMKQGVQERGKRAFFVVDSLELVDQAVERFVADGLDVGVIQGQHEMTNYRCPIQVATIQTLRSRWEHIAQAFKPDLLVLPHPSWRNTAWLKKNPWFEAEVLPYLRERVRRILTSASPAAVRSSEMDLPVVS